MHALAPVDFLPTAYSGRHYHTPYNHHVAGYRIVPDFTSPLLSMLAPPCDSFNFLMSAPVFSLALLASVGGYLFIISPVLSLAFSLAVSIIAYGCYIVNTKRQKKLKKVIITGVKML